MEVLGFSQQSTEVKESNNCQIVKIVKNDSCHNVKNCQSDSCQNVNIVRSDSCHNVNIVKIDSCQNVTFSYIAMHNKDQNPHPTGQKLDFIVWRNYQLFSIYISFKLCTFPMKY